MRAELRTGHQILKHGITDFDQSSVAGFEGVNSRAHRNNLAYKYKMFTIKTQLILFYTAIRQVEYKIYMKERTGKNSQDNTKNKRNWGLET